MGITATQKAMRLELARYVTCAALFKGLKDTYPFDHLKVLTYLPDGGYYTGFLRPMSQLISNDASEAFLAGCTHLMLDNLMQFKDYDLAAAIEAVKAKAEEIRNCTEGKQAALMLAQEMDDMITALYAPCLYKAVYETIMTIPSTAAGVQLNFSGTIPAYDLSLISADEIDLLAKILTEGPLQRKEIADAVFAYDGLKNYPATLSLLIDQS